MKGNIRNYINESSSYIHGHWHSIVGPKLTTEYFDNNSKEKAPVILLPGIFEKIEMLQFLAEKISENGNPVFIVPGLGYNFKDISEVAQLTRNLIDENHLEDIVILGHSKGGLVGKYLLINHNADKRIEKVIAVATPFSGSSRAGLFPFRPYKELTPESKMITTLKENSIVNTSIISIFNSTSIDPFLGSTEVCRLNGATNIRVETFGHHQILFSQELIEVVLNNLTDH